MPRPTETHLPLDLQELKEEEDHTMSMDSACHDSAQTRTYSRLALGTSCRIASGPLAVEAVEEDTNDTYSVQ